MKNSMPNAVILAAGFSSRFVPVCYDIPKGLVRVRGERLVERQIRQLKEIGVEDITVVTGAMAEHFDFLHRIHGVRLVHNPDYARKNNFSSLYAAREFLADTIVTSSDLFFTRNIFHPQPRHAYYASVFVRGRTKERSLTLDGNDKIVQTSYGGCNTWITFGGHAYLSRKVSRRLVDAMTAVYEDPAYDNAYWVDFQDANLQRMPMYIKRLKRSDIVEFNSLEALYAFDRSCAVSEQSPTLRFICQRLKVDEHEIDGWQPIKSGGMAVGCSFSVNGRKYEYYASGRMLKEV